MARFRSRCARAARAAAWVIAAAAGLASCGGGGGGGSTAGPFGIDTRPANLTCLAPDRSGGSVTVTTIDAFPAAPVFDQPTKILQAPGDGANEIEAKLAEVIYSGSSSEYQMVGADGSKIELPKRNTRMFWTVSFPR